MFERVEYTIARIDGDYAYLQRVDDSSEEEKCVCCDCCFIASTALLADEIVTKWNDNA